MKNAIEHASVPPIRGNEMGEANEFRLARVPAPDDPYASRYASEIEEKYWLLLTDVHDGVVLLDSDRGRIADCNSQFEMQTGRKLEELVRLSICDLGDPSQAESGRRRFAEVLAKGESSSDEIELRRPDGSSLSVEFRSRLIMLSGKRYVRAISRDISALQAAERKLRAQAEELRRFQKATVDRELRMRGLEERLACVAANIKAA